MKIKILNALNGFYPYKSTYTVPLTNIDSTTSQEVSCDTLNNKTIFSSNDN